MSVMLAKIFGFIIGDREKYSRLDVKLSLCDSPMETRFLIAAYPVLSQYGEIIPQHPIGNYRADFAIPACRIVIEVDGHDYHSSKAQLTADSKRQRDITLVGWTVIRFTGREIYADADACAREVEAIILRRG